VSRKGDHEYWKTLNHEIDYGGVEAFTFDLLAMDLSEFNVRSKPNTKELQEQKLLSLAPIPRWWLDCLYRGEIENGTWPDFISTLDAQNGIIEVSGGKVYQKPAAINVVQSMVKLCPSARSQQRQTKYDRHRGFALPSLQQARSEFEQYIGGPIDWPED
jgi:hypothetical protein